MSEMYPEHYVPDTERSRKALGKDVLSPSEFLETRRDIQQCLDDGLYSTDEAAEQLELLSAQNPTILQAWEADIQSQF